MADDPFAPTDDVHYIHQARAAPTPGDLRFPEGRLVWIVVNDLAKDPPGLFREILEKVEADPNTCRLYLSPVMNGTLLNVAKGKALPFKLVSYGGQVESSNGTAIAHAKGISVPDPTARANARIQRPTPDELQGALGGDGGGGGGGGGAVGVKRPVGRPQGSPDGAHTKRQRFKKGGAGFDD